MSSGGRSSRLSIPILVIPFISLSCPCTFVHSASAPSIRPHRGTVRPKYQAAVTRSHRTRTVIKGRTGGKAGATAAVPQRSQQSEPVLRSSQMQRKLYITIERIAYCRNSGLVRSRSKRSRGTENESYAPYCLQRKITPRSFSCSFSLVPQPTANHETDPPVHPMELDESSSVNKS
jgi:hypothetical protein